MMVSWQMKDLWRFSISMVSREPLISIMEGESYNKVSIGGRNVDELKDPATKRFGRLQGSPGGIYLDEGTQGVEVSNNVLHDVPIPVFYHNMIDYGYKTISFMDNIFGKRPGDEDFPSDITDCAGIEPLHRFRYV